MTKLVNDVADMVDGFLEAVLMSDHASLEKTADQLMGPASYGRLWQRDFHLMDPIADRMEGGSRYYLLSERQDEVAATWPIDIGIAVQKEDHIQLHYAQTIDPKEIRGIARLIPKHILALVCGWIYPDRQIYTETKLIGLLGNKWVDISVEQVSDKYRKRPMTASESAEINATIPLIIAAQLTARYSWHVTFGFSDNGPRIVLPTNPKGCLSLFRSRDKDAGESRRAALRHWVNEHYRDNSTDPTQVDYVREHLRGNTRFIWNSLDVELMPSEYDIEKNEYFRLRASEWRAARHHNRIRLKKTG